MRVDRSPQEDAAWLTSKAKDGAKSPDMQWTLRSWARQGHTFIPLDLPRANEPCQAGQDFHMRKQTGVV